MERLCESKAALIGPLRRKTAKAVPIRRAELPTDTPPRDPREGHEPALLSFRSGNRQSRLPPLACQDRPMDPTPSQAHSLWLEQSTLLSRSLNSEGHSTLQNCLFGDRTDDLALPLCKNPAPPGIHLRLLLWASEARDLSAQETSIGQKWKRLPRATTVTQPPPPIL